MRVGRLCAALVALSLAAVAGCGSDDGDSSPSVPEGGEGAQNACPVDGCEITIASAEPEGEELRLTWDANFAPDFSKNHVHVFWDTYTADEVTDDAAARGETQGEWVPTGDDPEFVTEGAVSTTVRGDSTTICVTAADRGHNVLDSSIVDCLDVSEHL